MEIEKVTKVYNIADWAAKAEERNALKSAFQTASTDAQGWMLGKELKKLLPRDFYRALMLGLCEGEGTLELAAESVLYPSIAECNAKASVAAQDDADEDKGA